MDEVVTAERLCGLPIVPAVLFGRHAAREEFLKLRLQHCSFGNKSQMAVSEPSDSSFDVGTRAPQIWPVTQKICNAKNLGKLIVRNVCRGCI
jgi:hypothetical protein